MEINPGAIILAIIIVVIVASILCMGLLMLLHALKVIRFHEKSGIAYGVIGGIALTFILFKTDFGCNKANPPAEINIEPLKTSDVR